MPDVSKCSWVAAGGYTMLIGTRSTHAIAPNLHSQLLCDPVRDFSTITVLGTATSSHPSPLPRRRRRLTEKNLDN